MRPSDAKLKDAALEIKEELHAGYTIMMLTPEKECEKCDLVVGSRRVEWPIKEEDEGDEDESVTITGVTVADKIVRDPCLDKNLEYLDTISVKSIEEVVYNERNIALSFSVNPSYSANKDICFIETIFCKDQKAKHTDITDTATRTPKEAAEIITVLMTSNLIESTCIADKKLPYKSCNIIYDLMPSKKGGE